MEIQVDRPTTKEKKEVRSVNIFLGTNQATVELWDEDKNRSRIKVDLSEIVEKDKQVIETFLSEIVAEATGLNIEDVPDTIFATEEKEVSN